MAKKEKKSSLIVPFSIKYEDAWVGDRIAKEADKKLYSKSEYIVTVLKYLFDAIDKGQDFIPPHPRYYIRKHSITTQPEQRIGWILEGMNVVRRNDNYPVEKLKRGTYGFHGNYNGDYNLGVGDELFFKMAVEKLTILEMSKVGDLLYRFVVEPDDIDFDPTLLHKGAVMDVDVKEEKMVKQ